MFDRSLRRSTRSAIVTRNQNHVGVALGNTGGDCAHAHLAHQFHTDAGIVVGILEIVDQLCQIFDRIDIMVRGRRNQAHTGG